MMADDDALGWYLDLPTREFPALGDEDEDAGPAPAAPEVAWRLWLNETLSDSEETFEEYFARFLEEVDASQVRELIIGGWGDPEDPADVAVAALVGAADRLTGLRGLALGDIPVDETEISLIQQTDLTPLLKAYPALEVLEIRGSDGLALAPGRHEGLRVLRIESAGLPGAVLQGISQAELPNAEYLELWLGEEEFGGDWENEDLAGILSGERLPALRHLGLQNSEFQDEVAELVADAPVVERLESLALSMGALTDQGAASLLSGQPLTHLKELDLHHHFLTDAMIERLRAALPTVALDVSDQETPEEENGEVYYYIAVSE